MRLSCRPNILYREKDNKSTGPRITGFVFSSPWSSRNGLTGIKVSGVITRWQDRAAGGSKAGGPGNGSRTWRRFSRLSFCFWRRCGCMPMAGSEGLVCRWRHLSGGWPPLRFWQRWELMQPGVSIFHSRPPVSASHLYKERKGGPALYNARSLHCTDHRFAMICFGRDDRAELWHRVGKVGTSPV
jgi:hypothetical protein